MRIAIYIPTDTDKVSGYVEGITERVSNIFGGCTVIPNCKGYWIKDEDTGYFVKTEKKRLIEDRITILEVFTNDYSVKDRTFGSLFTKKVTKYKRFIDICLDIKRDLKQDSVAYTIDNQIYFV